MTNTASAPFFEKCISAMPACDQRGLAWVMEFERSEKPIFLGSLFRKNLVRADSVAQWSYLHFRMVLIDLTHLFSRKFARCAKSSNRSFDGAHERLYLPLKDLFIIIQICSLFHSRVVLRDGVWLDGNIRRVGFTMQLMIVDVRFHSGLRVVRGETHDLQEAPPLEIWRTNFICPS
jgi:hypothetical protein